MPMPNRNVEGGYRYGYQGEFAEKESEMLGVNSFELRLYDSRIGRWISPDPYGQFHSPYLAMNNNPISFADSDGGCTTPGGRPCAFSVLGGTATDAGGNVWSGAGDIASELHSPFSLNEITVVGTKPNFLKSLRNDNALKRLVQDNELKRTTSVMRDFMGDMRENNARIMRERVGSVYKAGAEYGLMGSGLYSGLRPRAVTNTISKRAFFSGAGTEARAISEGFQTISQTIEGKYLNVLTEGMDYFPGSDAYKMWARLSSSYAKGVPEGSTVNVFLNNPSPTGIWNAVEKDILLKHGVKIIEK